MRHTHRSLTAAGASLLLIGLLAMAGCSCAPSRTPSSSPVSLSEAAVGDTLPLGSDLSVTLVSVGTTVPLGLEADSSQDVLWLVLDVTNSTDGTVTLSSRPRSPEVLDPGGNQLHVKSTSVRLSGGGGFGVASSGLGEPYLRPGGVMRMTAAVADAVDAGRPLTIRYAPFLRHGAEFSVE